MTELERLKQDLYHDTKLVLQRLNRKLEKYGSVEVESPLFAPGTVKTRISMYRNIETQIYSILRNMYIPKGEWNPVRTAPDNTMYFSLSKDSVERLSVYYDQLNKLNESIPTWSEYLKSITHDNFNPLRKADREEAIRTLDIIEARDYVVSLEELLENSEQLEYDETMQELLKPFRNTNKGGTRNSSRGVTKEEYDKLKEYTYNLQKQLAGIRQAVSQGYTGVNKNEVVNKIKNGGIFKKRKR